MAFGHRKAAISSLSNGHRQRGIGAVRQCLHPRRAGAARFVDLGTAAAHNIAKLQHSQACRCSVPRISTSKRSIMHRTDHVLPAPATSCATSGGGLGRTRTEIQFAAQCLVRPSQQSSTRYTRSFLTARMFGCRRYCCKTILSVPKSNSDSRNWQAARD
jgi:hypothetical protein